MDSKVHNFDAAGNHPAAWLWIGHNLLISADLLRREHTVSPDRAPDQTAARVSAAVLGPMLMLRACAFECLLKALYLDAGGTLAEGGRYLAPKGRAHDLCALADAAGFALSEDERYFLDYLALWITQGRYPIQRAWTTNLAPHRSGRIRESNWSREDERRFTTFRDRFQSEGDRLGAKPHTSGY
jgi:hypothetical protein